MCLLELPSRTSYSKCPGRSGPGRQQWLCLGARCRLCSRSHVLNQNWISHQASVVITYRRGQTIRMLYLLGVLCVQIVSILNKSTSKTGEALKVHLPTTSSFKPISTVKFQLISHFRILTVNGLISESCMNGNSGEGYEYWSQSFHMRVIIIIIIVTHK